MAIFSIHNAKDLGAAIRDRRLALGLDQAELANRVGVSRAWIIDIEKGKPKASVELVLRTLHILGVQFIANTASPDTITDIDTVFANIQKRRP